MGPVGSPISKMGVEITDSPYVVCNMHIMTRVGDRYLTAEKGGDLFPVCIPSVPRWRGQKGCPWPCAPMEKKYISHFPEENLSGLMVQVTAAMRSWGKNAWPCGIASAIAGAKAGWPSIC